MVELDMDLEAAVVLRDVKADIAVTVEREPRAMSKYHGRNGNMSSKCLIVGINDYGGECDLHGCVNDAKDVANTLSVIHVAPPSAKSIRIRTDARATKKNILSDLRWLIRDVRPGDTRIFWYSGHGSYVLDTSGDEGDKKDECLVPHDYDSAGMITDDEIQDAIQGFPTGATLEIFLDSCFSGTATRSITPTYTRPSLRIRFMPPPFDEEFFGDNPHTETRWPIFSRQTIMIPTLNHILWAGCRDNQTSAEDEIEGDPRGVFTYHLCKILRKSSGIITRKQLSTQIARDVKSMGYEQIPVLEANKGKIKGQVFR